MNETAEAIRQLLQKEQFAALSTAKEDKPYINLVAFSGTDDLSLIIFCTPRKTRKYENLQHNPRVALLVENSRNQAVDLTQAMALELAPVVRVNAISPGYTLTPMQRAEYTDEMLDAVNRKIPMQRHAKPEEMAALFAFLASEDAAFASGHVYVMDGAETTGGLCSQWAHE